MCCNYVGLKRVEATGAGEITSLTPELNMGLRTEVKMCHLNSSCDLFLICNITFLFCR